MADIAPDTLPEPQAPVVPNKFCELAIHVAFQDLPLLSDPNYGESEQPVKYGPPFLRFPVNLTAEDAVVLEKIFRSASIAMIGFEVKDSDGNPRTYTSITPRY